MRKSTGLYPSLRVDATGTEPVNLNEARFGAYY